MVWSWLAPTLPPPQPQLEAWTDNSHLFDVLLTDLGLEAAGLVTREQAMRVPAVSRARNLTCGTIARLPVEVLRLDAPVTPQPYWVAGTDGQLGDLTADEAHRWGLTPQHPFHRMVWTVDDVFFHGMSLWLATSTDRTGRPTRLARVPYGLWNLTDGALTDQDGRPFPEARCVFFAGASEGLLVYGRDTITTAAALEKAAAGAAAHPVRFELHQTTAAQLTKAEKAELITDTKQALASNDGILFTNAAIETKAHRVDSEALQLGARNASALDVARDANMPAAMIDATTEGSSLEYQTLEGRNQQWLDYGLTLFMDPITARLSMDDVLPAGQRAAFDTTDWTAAEPAGTGPATED
jgi:hypothetical protein